MGCCFSQSQERVNSQKCNAARAVLLDVLKQENPADTQSFIAALVVAVKGETDCTDYEARCTVENICKGNMNADGSPAGSPGGSPTNNEPGSESKKKKAAPPPGGAAQWQAYVDRVHSAEGIRPDMLRATLIGGWIRFDKDASGDFSPSEIAAFIDALNFPDDLAASLVAECKTIAKQAKKKSLHFPDFEAAWAHAVTFKELRPIFEQYASPGKKADEQVLTPAGLFRFLGERQLPALATFSSRSANAIAPVASITTTPKTAKTAKGKKASAARRPTSVSLVSTAESEKIMQQLGVDVEKTGGMDFRTFARYIVGTENTAVDSAMARRVYQKMTFPLHYYFVNSSHNTYLTGDQLTSKSSPDAYVKALRDGCRCVELDCWDGKDGEPIIYHGYTRTSKISFESVIEAINQHAFTISEYAVILSLEVHTSVDQQKKMAAIMKRVFGPKLELPQWQPGEAPRTLADISPEKTKHKIIVKSKRLPPGKDEVDEESKEGAPVEGEDMDAKQAAGGEGDDSTMNASTVSANGNGNGSGLATKSTQSNGNGNGNGGGKKKKMMKLAKELSDLTWMESKHMAKTFGEVFASAKPYEVVSLGESKSTKFATAQREEITKHNMCRFTRVYPGGQRIDSSNYHPQQHWNVGAQIVALNWQTCRSFPLRLNKGRFLENANSGYVLKPSYLLPPGALTGKDEGVNAVPAGASFMSTKPMRLHVDVLSCFALPKPEREERGEVIDPYVKIFIEGPGCPGVAGAKQTIVIDDNGFHPSWVGTPGAEMDFDVPCPEMSTAVFQIFDKDLQFDDFIAECFVPVSMLRQGVRSFPLLDETSQPLAMSFLLCNLSLEHTTADGAISAPASAAPSPAKKK